MNCRKSALVAGLVCAAFATGGAVDTASAQTEPAVLKAVIGSDKTMRNLSDYTNDNGTRPDGKRVNGDDTSALKKAIAAGPGVVNIGPGTYRWGEVTLPAGVTVRGQGEATIVRSNGAKQIFRQFETDSWAIRDLVLEGEGTGDWRKREDKGFDGIFVERCSMFEITGVTFRNFEGAGLHLRWTLVPEKGFRHSGTLSRLHADGNAVGIHFDERAEYLNGSELACYHNATGCIVNAGNVKLVDSSFVENTDGILIEDKQNGSHGIISGCMVNHNERYALLARNALNGMIISGTTFYYGKIQLENSVGLNFTGGVLACHVGVTGGAANRFAGNFVVPEGYEFKFTPSTIIQDNFTKDGPWTPK